MTVVIEKNRTISGIDPYTAQKIARLCCDSYDGVGPKDVAAALNSTEATAKTWLSILKEDGYVKLVKKGGKKSYHVTDHGRWRLAAARIGKPMTYREVEQQLRKISERAMAYNSNERFPYLVNEIKVGGIEERSDGYSQDPDIVIKHIMRDAQSDSRDWRWGYLKEYGPEYNLTIVNQVFFADRELRKILLKGIKKVGVLDWELDKEDGYPFEWHTLFKLDLFSDNAVRQASDNQTRSFVETVDVSFLEEYARRVSRGANKAVALLDIADYWNRKSRADKRGSFACNCWRCGSEDSLQKCHIVPRSLGGTDGPDNLVILCSRCHAEAPNISDESIMWDWISSHKVADTLNYWGLVDIEEYKSMYGYSLNDMAEWLLDQIDVSEENEISLDFGMLVEKTLNKTSSTHFGQGSANCATMAGAMRLALKEIVAMLPNEDFDTLERRFVDQR